MKKRELTPAMEDYLKAAYLLSEQGEVTVLGLAQALGVATPSVTGMVGRLAKRGLLQHQKYRSIALTPAGEGARAIDEGWVEKDGKLPVNPSGGLKAKGHPIGATGVSMHALAAMQLTGTAGGMQVKGAKLAGIFNMGGAAVANYVSILEPLRA